MSLGHENKITSAQGLGKNWFESN